MSELAEFSKLAVTLEAWRAQIVFVGGWAYRLYQYEPRALDPGYPPIFTQDADVAYPQVHLQGDIKAALEGAGFKEEPNFAGDFDPLAMRYVLEDGGGFYAEFLTPLTGSGRRRVPGTKDTVPDATVRNGGVVAQKLRHLEVLLHRPWSVTIPAEDTGLDEPLGDLNIPNPASFIIQKLLIHDDRPRDKRAQDVLYIHDAFVIFNGAIEGDLAPLWKSLEAELTDKQRATLARVAEELFSRVNDTIRAAAEIREQLEIDPADILGVCRNGFEDLFGAP